MPVASRRIPNRDGWLVYEPAGLMCGLPPRYRVRVEEAFADFPEVVKHLGRPERPVRYQVDLKGWRESDPDASDPRHFLREMRAARLAQLKQRDPAGL